MIAIALQNWKLIIIGILLLVVSGMGFYVSLLKSQKESIIAEKNILIAELAVSQASVKGLQAAIDDQNAAVEKLKTDAEIRMKASLIEIAKAKTAAENSKKRADDIMRARPPVGVPKCDAANDLFNQEINSAK